MISFGELEAQTLASEVAVVSILKMDKKNVCEANNLLLTCHESRITKILSCMLDKKNDDFILPV